MKGTSNSTNAPGDSSTHTNVATDAMTWATSWEMMNRTLEAFATMNTDSSDRGSVKSRKTFKKPEEFKDDSDGCIDKWVRSHETTFRTRQLQLQSREYLLMKLKKYS